MVQPDMTPSKAEEPFAEPRRAVAAAVRREDGLVLA
jgi:hypothetical protein